MNAEPNPGAPVDSAQDFPGCIVFGFRFTGCFLSLYIVMFAAILAVALISLFFFH